MRRGWLIALALLLAACVGTLDQYSGPDPADGDETIADGGAAKSATDAGGSRGDGGEDGPDPVPDAGADAVVDAAPPPVCGLPETFQLSGHCEPYPAGGFAPCGGDVAACGTPYMYQCQGAPHPVGPGMSGKCVVKTVGASGYYETCCTALSCVRGDAHDSECAAQRPGYPKHYFCPRSTDGGHEPPSSGGCVQLAGSRYCCET